METLEGKVDAEYKNEILFLQQYKLTKLEKLIYKLCFLKNKSISEVAKILGMNYKELECIRDNLVYDLTSEHNFIRHKKVPGYNE